MMCAVMVGAMSSRVDEEAAAIEHAVSGGDICSEVAVGYLSAMEHQPPLVPTDVDTHPYLHLQRNDIHAHAYFWKSRK